jgi:hypothetical protein
MSVGFSALATQIALVEREHGRRNHLAKILQSHLKGQIVAVGSATAS